MDGGAAARAGARATTTTVGVGGGATLRDVVEALAPLERRAGSSAEREAAAWLVARLREAGARDARRAVTVTEAVARELAGH